MATVNLYPVGVGVSGLNQLTANGAASTWLCVDDPAGSPDDASTYVQTPGDTQAYSDFALTTMPAASAIQSVVVWFRAKDPPGESSWPSVYVLTHSTWYLACQLNNGNDTWTTLSKTYNTNPNTGVAWTWQEVEDLELRLVNQGLSKIGPINQTTQAYVVVTYTPEVASDSAAHLLLI